MMPTTRAHTSKRKRDEVDDQSAASQLKTKRRRPSLQHHRAAAASRRATSQPPLTASTLEAAARGSRSNPDQRIASWLGLEASESALNMSSTTKETNPRSGRSSRPASTSTRSSAVSSIYDRAVPNILTDAGVYALADSEQAKNFEEIQERLGRARPSASPELDDYRKYSARYNKIEDDNEEIVKHIVITPFFIRPDRHNYGVDSSFNGLSPLTLPSQPRIPAPKPDYYTGANMRELSREVRNDCQRHVVPRQSGPILVNQSLEVKGPRGPPGTAPIQARHNGAAGARAIDALRSYGEPKLDKVYDGRARSHSSTFIQGQMTFYATHTRQAPGGEKTYHINRIGSESTFGSFENFKKTYRMYRNQEDLAEEDRLEAITKAHSRLPSSGSSPPRKRRTTNGNRPCDSFPIGKFLDEGPEDEEQSDDDDEEGNDDEDDDADEDEV